MANVIRFAIKTIQGTVFWKFWGYFLAEFLNKQLSSLQFIYTDIKSVFDRAMAWIALIFYWFDSIYQWLTSGRTSWPRGEGGEVLINMFCVRGFEVHPCRLVFKNTWTEIGRSKKNRMANVIRFSIETIQGMVIWKFSGKFFDRFSTKNYRFSLEAIQNQVSFIFLFCFVW